MKEFWRPHNNARADETLSSKVDQLFRAIDLCLEQGLWEPTLILLYSGIDAMAWLDRPDHAPDVNSTHFISWCERYLLDPVDHALTGADLYGARCGLLHSHTADSKRYREGKVVKLFYSRSIARGELGLDQLKFEPVWPLWADIDILVDRFKNGVTRFREDFKNDPERRNLICDRVNSSYFVEVLASPPSA
jgi:hypothetical protein